MRRVPLAKVAAFSPFTQFLQAGGCELERRLSAAGIDPEALGSEESFVPFVPATEFLVKTERQEGIEDFGLEVGRRASMSDLGSFGTALCQSLTLNDLIRKMLQWLPAVNSGARVWIDEVPESDNLCFSLLHDIDTGRETIDGFALFLLIDAVRMAAGPTWRPERLSPGRTDSKNFARYEALSESSINHDIDHVAIEIPREFLSRPVTPPPGKVGLPPVSEHLLEQTSAAEDLVGSILQAIQSGLSTRSVTIQHTAEMASLSIRTLQRKLSAEGFVYSDLVDRVRYQKSRQLLAEGGLTIAEIGHLLGYSYAANFTHAFHRWTGETPSKYRDRLR